MAYSIIFKEKFYDLINIKNILIIVMTYKKSIGGEFQILDKLAPPKNKTVFSSTLQIRVS